MPSPASVDLPSLHSPEMIREEGETMLGIPSSGVTVTPGAFYWLTLSGSPFASGELEELSAEDLAEARRVLKAPSAEPEEILRAVSTAIRPFSILEKRDGSATGCYHGVCPEWLADIYHTISPSGGLSWDAFLWKTPLCVAAHLFAASIRAQGGKTARPVDWKAALASIQPGTPPGTQED